MQQSNLGTYKVELGYNAVEATKNIYCVKSLVDPITVTRWFKKFHLGCREPQQSDKLR